MISFAARAYTIGYVVKMFPRLSETFILNEILELERQEMALHIFSMKRPVEKVVHAHTSDVRSPVTYLPESFLQSSLSILGGQLYVWRKHRSAWRHTLRNVLRRARPGSNRADFLAFCQACCLIHDMRGISHLHAHYASVPARLALLVRRISGASYSITTHAKDIFQDNPFASPKLLERMLHARFVVANSRFSADHIRSGLEAPVEIHTIYNGVDLNAFPLRKSAPEEPVILSVGRLVEKKGFSDLISACQILKQRGARFTCDLVGTGRLSEALKIQIRNCAVGDRIRMLGPLPQQVLRQHLERAMVFALPCIQAADGDRDILPNVIKEAMAVGVPVVTTRLDGIEELIEDGVSGALVPPGDPPALAAKLELLLNHRELRGRLAAGGRTMIEERFDRRSNIVKLKSLLQSATDCRPTEASAPPGSEPETRHANCLRQC
jgi:glycosyltransferase involved in cell wall biosynthesis